MVPTLGRRRFLQASALAAPALACTRVVRDAHGAEAPRIEAPVVDSLSIQVVTDGNHDIFISGAQVPGVKVERVRGFRRRARAPHPPQRARPLALPDVPEGRRDAALPLGLRLN